MQTVHSRSLNGRHREGRIISTRSMCAAAIFMLFFIDISRGQDVFHAFHSEPALTEALCDINALENIPSVSVINCMTQCSSNGQCLSFSFARSERLCWLHTILVSAGATGQSRKGTQCYNMMHDVCDASSGYLYHPPLNFCFKMYNIFTDYNDAQSKCLEDRAYLLRLDNLPVLTFLPSNLIHEQYFVQSNYNTAVSQWQFDDGTHIDLTVWLKPIAVDSLTANSRLILDKSYTYYWIHEIAPLARFVCQKFVKDQLITVAASTTMIQIGIQNVKSSVSTTKSATSTPNVNPFVSSTNSPIGTASVTPFAKSSMPPVGISNVNG